MRSRHGRVFEQLVCRSRYERERCAQFVAYVGEELQLCLCKLFYVFGHLLLLCHAVFEPLVDARFGAVGSYDVCASGGEQQQCCEHDEQEGALQVEVGGGFVYTAAQSR